jgi:hypothetical protein
MPMFRIIFLVLCFGALTARAETPALSQIVHVTAIEGVLKIEPDDSYQINPRPMIVQGPESKWQVSISRAARPTAPQILSLVRPAGGTQKPEEYWTISITAMSDEVGITADRAVRRPHDTTLRMAQRADKSIRVHIVDGAKPEAGPINFDAANLLALRAKQPDVVARFIVPMLTQLFGEDPLLPGPADVYRAFYEIPPQESTVAALQRVLPKLSAASSERRESASVELEDLGPVGVCAAVHLDQKELPPETAARIEAYLANYSRRRFDDPQVMRDDLPFLADCMDFPFDSRVRSAARARFEQLTRHAIPPADWAHAAEYARGQIAGSRESRESRPMQ